MLKTMFLLSCEVMRLHSIMSNFVVRFPPFEIWWGFGIATYYHFPTNGLTIPLAKYINLSPATFGKIL